MIWAVQATLHTVLEVVSFSTNSAVTFCVGRSCSDLSVGGDSEVKLRLDEA
jgi:hypothetical protein